MLDINLFADKDISINVLNLSQRTLNCLRRNNIHSICDLLSFESLDSLRSLRYFGSKSYSELVDKLKKYELSLIANDTADFSSNEAELLQDFLDFRNIDNAIIHYLHPETKYRLCAVHFNMDGIRVSNVDVDNAGLSTRLQNCLRHHDVTQMNQLLPCSMADLNDWENFGTKTKYELFDWLKKHVGITYNPSDMNDGLILQNSLLFLICNNDSGLSFSEICNQLPNIDESCVQSMLMELLRNNSIQFDLDKYHKPLQSIDVKLNDSICFSNSHAQDVCRHILQSNMTLTSTSHIYGVTKERIRQIFKNSMSRLKTVREDLYKGYFETYDIPVDLFKDLFDVSDIGYRYLKCRYHKGEESIENLMSNSVLSDHQKQKIIDYLNKEYIMIDGVKIKISSVAIIRYLVQKYGEDACDIDFIRKQFMQFCEEHSLDKYISMSDSKHKFEVRLAKLDCRYVLYSNGFNIRYYDIDSKNLDFFFRHLDFTPYMNTIISTDKIYGDYADLMKLYDIRSGDELHNFIRKCADRLPSYVCVCRMPLLKIGQTDRKKQLTDLLFEIAPVSISGLINEFQNRYGVKAGTVYSNWLHHISEYLNNDAYILSSKSLPGDNPDE